MKRTKRSSFGRAPPILPSLQWTSLSQKQARSCIAQKPQSNKQTTAGADTQTPPETELPTCLPDIEDYIQRSMRKQREERYEERAKREAEYEQRYARNSSDLSLHPWEADESWRENYNLAASEASSASQTLPSSWPPMRRTPSPSPTLPHTSPLLSSSLTPSVTRASVPTSTPIPESIPQPIPKPEPLPKLGHMPVPAPASESLSRTTGRPVHSKTQRENARAARLEGPEGVINPKGPCETCRKADKQCWVLRSDVGKPDE
ncbi:hypothetical protein BJ170DRAFT_68292 [Xylariales sp. AK1849]|nr:hypothetical protein BJ170DRAFT_68292 [Xylariales sp. AK1849]